MSQERPLFLAQEGEVSLPESTARTEAPAPLAEEAERKEPSGSDPLMVLLFVGMAGYLFKLWLDDYKAARHGKAHERALPGIFPAKLGIVLVGIVGALVLVGIETAGEYALGVSAQQSDIMAIFLLSMIAAGFMEEVVFRGYLVVTSKGRIVLLASIVGFSLIFALLHPFFWDYELPDGASSWAIWQATFTFDFGAKAWFSSVLVFVNSLWFYAMRFNPLNPQRSLIPCFAAHIASNVGVFVVKLAQGHVVGLW